VNDSQKYLVPCFNPTLDDVTQFYQQQQSCITDQ